MYIIYIYIYIQWFCGNHDVYDIYNVLLHIAGTIKPKSALQDKQGV